MNYEQLKGASDRLAAVLVGSGLTWLVTKGYLGESEAVQLAPLVVGFISFGVGVYVNRRASIAKSAANLGIELAKADPIEVKRKD